MEMSEGRREIMNLSWYVVNKTMCGITSASIYTELIHSIGHYKLQYVNN